MDGSGAEARAFLFAGFRLEPENGSLTFDRAPVALTPMVFRTLVCLVRRAGEVVTKDELVEAVWAGRIVGDSTISQTVHTLRQALETAGSPARLISTVSGRGYRFVGEARIENEPKAVLEVAADPIGRAPAGPTLMSRPDGRLRVAATAAILGALTAAIAALIILAPWRRHAPPGPPPVIVQAEFQNLTGDHTFDRSLGRVVEVDLGQSPRIDVLTPRQVAETLGQMSRPADEPLDPRLAGQVCQRNNGHAVVEGALAPVGHRFLLTLTATGCASGRLISAEKKLVDRRDDIIPALDALIDKTRRDLGESAETVRRFDVPLLRGQTASIEALEAYSEGARMADRGRLPEAIALQQHAVDLDPSFAAAHLELARALFNAGRYVQSRAELRHAYQLRGAANAELRYSIEILYHLTVDLDYRQAMAMAKAATDVFPGHLIGWGQQANLDIQFGRYDAAVAEARTELALDPSREGAYFRLAVALTASGRFDAAEQVCRDAVAHKAAGGLIATERAALALARRDPTALNMVLAEAHGQPWEADVVFTAAQAAYGSGQIRRGNQLFQKARGLSVAAGQDDYLLGYQAIGLLLAGEREAALGLITPLPPRGEVLDLSKVNTLYVLSEAGEARRAHALLEEFLRRDPSDTTLNIIFAPCARAALDLAQGRAGDALSDLSPAAVYEARDNAAPFLRGRIDLALGDGVGAAREFHKVTDHPGIDPPDIRHALAWVGLARADKLQGRADDSRQDYLRFLALWRNADPDVPVLLQARTELAALPAPR